MARRADADADSYYYANIEVGQSYIRIMKVVDGGAPTQIAILNNQTSVVANTNYKVRFRLEQDGPSQVKLWAKYWDASLGEPGSWMLNGISDSDARLGSVGANTRLGLWFGFNSAGNTWVNDFFVNQDSDTFGRQQWSIDSGSSFVTLQNLKTDGAYPTGAAYDVARDAQNAISVGGATTHDIVVQSVDSRHAYGDGFYAGSKSYNVTYQNSYLQYTGRQGLSVCDNHNVLIYNNYVGEAQRSLFDIEPYGGDWYVDNLRIIGNTTGDAGNRWLSVGTTGSLYVANNTVQGTYGLPYIYDTGNLTTGYRGPLVVLNNNFTNGTNVNTLCGLDMLGAVFMGNMGTYSTSAYSTVVNVTSSQVQTPSLSQGAVVGNNHFTNAQTAVHVDTAIQDSWVWDNTTDTNPSWTSSVNIIETADAYYFTAPYSDAVISGGSIVGLMRKFVGTTQVSYNNLTTTGDLAMVMLDANGDMVNGWNSYGQGTYNGVALPSPGAIPVLLASPQGQNVTAGSSVTFSAVADGGNVPLAYQWKRNAVPIVDATASSYTFTAASGDNGAQYTCVITNRYGTVTTSAAALTVSAAAAPTITTNPSAASVVTGATATFSVVAAGPGPLGYQWQKNGVNITGATASMYTTPVTVAGDNGAAFQCVVTNTTGSTTSASAAMTVTTVATPIQETWAGTTGNPWPSSPNVWNITKTGDAAVDIQSNQGNIKYVTGTSTVVAALDPTGPWYDNVIDSVQQVTILGTSTNVGMEGGLIARRADSNPSVYYRATLTYSGSPVLIIMAGSTQVGISAPSVWTANTSYYLKFSVVSLDSATTELKAKVWKTTDTEPDWTLTVNDTTASLQGVSGRAGVYGSVVVSTARWWRFDDYNYWPPVGAVPSGVTNLAAVAKSANHAYLTWQDNSGNESGVVVQRSSDNVTWTDRAYLATNATSYMDTGLAASTRYYYRIRACNGQGWATDSSSVMTTTLDSDSSSIAENWAGVNGDAWAEKWAVQGSTGDISARDIQSSAGRLLCDGSATGGVIAYLNPYTAEGVDQTVTFKTDTSGTSMGLVARRADAERYYSARVVAGDSNIHIYRCVNGTETELASIAYGSTISTGTDYKIRFLCQTNGSATDLKVKVWLSGSNEPGSWSAAITDNEPTLQNVSGTFGLWYGLGNNAAFTTANYTASYTGTSAGVSGLSVTAASATQLNLSWTDNSSRETGYRVERSPNGRNQWAAVTTLSAGTPSYSDTGLTPSTRYYYRVVAVNSGGTDAYQTPAYGETADVSGDVRGSFTADDYSSWPSNPNWPAKWTMEGDINGATTIDVYDNALRVVRTDSCNGMTVRGYVNNATAVDTNQVVTGWVSDNSGGFGLISRRADANTYYFARIATADNNAYLFKVLGGTATQISKVALGFTPVIGAKYNIRLLTTQTNSTTTTLNVRVWQAGTAEPATWKITATNTDAALQNVNGRNGVLLYLLDRRIMMVDNYVCSSGSYLSVPSAPTGLSATAASPSQINLSWTGPSNNESGFVVEQSPNGASGWAEVARVAPDTTSYSVKNLAANTAYYYRVKAFNGIADSSYTSNATATTWIAIPTAPTNLSATPFSGTEIDLAWTDTSSNETGFAIERSDDGGVTFNQIGTVGAGVTNYPSTGLSPSTTYHYRVRSYNGSGNSAYGTIVNATTAAVTVTISATDANAAEQGQDTGTFAVTRAGTAGDLVVNYTISGTAASGDYTPTLGGTVTIPNGQTSANIVITPANDTEIENAETVILTLATGTGYTVGSPTNATVTILDNDVPSVSIAATDANAAEQGQDTGTYTVTRAGTGLLTQGDLVVNYTISGTASSADYTPTLGGTVTIPSGQASANIVITPVDDSAAEGSETLILTLATGTGYTVGTPTNATVTIADNDIGETWTGSNGAAWPACWTFTGQALTTKDIQSNAGRVYCSTGGAKAVAYNTTRAFQDSTQLVSLKGSSNGPALGLNARIVAADDDTKYAIETGGLPSNLIYLKRYVDGTATTLATYTLSYTANYGVWYNIAFYCVQNGSSTDLKGKIWPTGQSDPGWLITASDNNARLQNLSGYGGLYMYATANRYIYADDYSASNGGGMFMMSKGGSLAAPQGLAAPMSAPSAKVLVQPAAPTAAKAARPVRPSLVAAPSQAASKGFVFATAARGHASSVSAVADPLDILAILRIL